MSEHKAGAKKSGVGFLVELEKETVDEVKAESLEARIEYEGEDSKESKQKIEKLKQEVEENRKKYLEKDYQSNKAVTRLRKFFGSFLKKPGEMGIESDKELAEYRAYYDNSLLELKKAKISEARLKGISGDRLLDIAEFFQTEANINLADAHDQVKIENQEGKFSGFFKEHSRELVEKYKKMHWAKKMAIGAAFGLAGAGAIYIGGVVVGIAGSAIAARRAFLAFATGTSVSLGFEARGKKKTEKENKKEMEDLEKKTKELSEEEKLKILEDFINENIQDEDRKIDKIKNKNLRHLAYGVAAGLGVALAPKITRLFSASIGMGDAALEGSEGAGGKSGIPLEIPKEEVLGEAGAEAAKVSEAFIVEAQKGDSVWKIIGRQLENQKGYAGLNVAQKTYVIDALKDKVAANPGKFGLEDIDKLKIGQRLDLSEILQEKQAEGLIAKAQNLNSEQMERILNNNLAEELQEPERLGMTEEEIEKNLEAQKAENISPVSSAKEIPEAENMQETFKVPKELNGKDIPEVADRQVEENIQAEEEPEIQLEPIRAEKLGSTLISEEAHRIAEKSADELGKKIAGINLYDDEGFFTGGSAHWDKIKDIKYSAIQSKDSAAVAPYVKSRLGEIISAFKEKLGSEGVPKPDEKLKDWLVRLTEKHGKDKIPSLENIIEKYGSRSAER